MRHRIAIGVVFGLSLCTPLVPAQDAPAGQEPPEGELRRMLIEPPDVRTEFPRVDAPEFTLEQARRSADRFDPSRPAQKRLLRDVDVLDQLAREILRWQAKQRRPLTVVWLFDQSRSMTDDWRTVSLKLSRVLSERDGVARDIEALTKQLGPPRIAPIGDPLLVSHLVFEFGKSCRLLTPLPTRNPDAVKDAFERVTIDESGVENTFHAILKAMREAREAVPQGSRLLLAVVTDESGNDDRSLEDALSAAEHDRVPIYVIGRQAVFGMSEVRLNSPANGGSSRVIRRGPESADVEVLAWDGLQPRDDEQPAGFAPYALARLVRDSGGIYFLLPSEESQRVKRREKAYSIVDLREYAPDYESRETYVAARERSVLRRTLYGTIQVTRDYSVPLHFADEPRPIEESLANAADRAERQLAQLVPIETTLREMQRERNREPSRRWQANYDLMLAQIVAFQVTLREYRAAVFALRRKVDSGAAGTVSAWELGHSPEPQAPEAGTNDGYEEAERLLALVIKRHPNTPWADLAQTIRDRGLSVEFRPSRVASAPRAAVVGPNY